MANTISASRFVVRRSSSLTQYAIIKKLTGPEKAEVEVLRGTA